MVFSAFFSSPKNEPEPLPVEDLETKIDAFKKIYRALREAQNNIGYFKTDWLINKEELPANDLYFLINEHISDDVKNDIVSRTQEAWNLALKHYKECHGSNLELFNAIYATAMRNTHLAGFKIYSKVRNFTKQEISEGKHILDENGKKIVHELEWNAKNFKYNNNSGPAM